MLALTLGLIQAHTVRSSDDRTVLAIGAHSDDVEIGCGGTLSTLVAAGWSVHLLVLSAVGERAREARRSAADLLGESASSLVIRDIPDGRFPAHWDQVKGALEETARSVQPALILAPRRGDAHQDHDTVAAIVPTVFRGNLTLHYEIPKWDGDMPRLNMYVPLEETQLQRKVELLQRHFVSQRGRGWFDHEIFFGLARLRGVECKSRYAEAFECNKSVLSI